MKANNLCKYLSPFIARSSLNKAIANDKSLFRALYLTKVLVPSSLEPALTGQALNSRWSVSETQHFNERLIDV